MKILIVIFIILSNATYANTKISIDLYNSEGRISNQFNLELNSTIDNLLDELVIYEDEKTISSLHFEVKVLKDEKLVVNKKFPIRDFVVIYEEYSDLDLSIKEFNDRFENYLITKDCKYLKNINKKIGWFLRFTDYEKSRLSFYITTDNVDESDNAIIINCLEYGNLSEILSSKYLSNIESNPDTKYEMLLVNEQYNRKLYLNELEMNNLISYIIKLKPEYEKKLKDYQFF